MNVLEYQMIEILKKLKNEFGVVKIKAEYENEGSREVELMRLKDVADAVGLPVIIKIGGVEAVTNIYSALSVGAKGIIAPMAETAFAVNKFLDAINTFIPEDNQKDVDFTVNIETITAYHNIDSILSLKNIALLNSITVGRVDFTASLGGDRSFVDSDDMLKYCTEIFEKAKKKGLDTTLGGAISGNSVPFIKNLISKELLDRYETRKIVYEENAIKNAEEGLFLGIEFELLWLKSKRRYYHRVRDEDEKRIAMLEQRVREK
ncbi:MAG TPA: aldolase/citrate lyase family protein [Candidatus Omnitrophota bacterium]|nr:aldolase/citrate lyase family protein [Candidatus Omnitrophota bacterium]HPS21085.1 aldolase/citrate lyase family protein [Candidatus Omnitrophota bacterium]